MRAPAPVFHIGPGTADNPGGWHLNVPILSSQLMSVPDLSLVTLAVLFGISLIFRGVFACVAAFKLRKVRKEGADVAPPFGAAPA